MAASTASLALLPAVDAAGALLIVAGAFKLSRPPAAQRALGEAGWRIPGTLVRCLGAAELALGAALVARPGPLTAAAAALAYACFALFLVRLMRRARADVDCGCFGPSGGTASALHVWLNAALAAACATAVVAPPPPPAWIAGQTPLTAIALCLGLGAVVYAAFLAFTVVPRAWSAYTAEESR
jgi:hypothetical protein